MWPSVVKKLARQRFKKMAKHLAIVEGNHQGLVRTIGGRIYGAAEGFADCLKALDEELTFRILRPHFDDYAYAEDVFEGCDGIVFTGSANSWSADEAPAAPARQLMRLALSTGRPVFGSCYGLQLAVAVLGGRNQSNPVETEFAIARAISVNKAGANHPLYKGKAPLFDARCMHRDEIADLPQGAVSLASNDHSQHQAIAYEQDGVRFWGVQYHPELSFGDIARYMALNDVDSFSDAKSFAAKHSVEADGPDVMAEIMADFHQLDEDMPPELVTKYQLSEALMDKTAHRCELINFLAQL